MKFTMSFWLLVVIVMRLANFPVVEIDKLDLDASGFARRRDDVGEYARHV